MYNFYTLGTPLANSYRVETEIAEFKPTTLKFNFRPNAAGAFAQ